MEPDIYRVQPEGALVPTILACIFPRRLSGSVLEHVFFFCSLVLRPRGRSPMVDDYASYVHPFLVLVIYV